MSRDDVESGLELDAEAMRALGYAAVDALVERYVRLPDAAPWDGRPVDRPALNLPADCPEEGAPAAEVLERALRDVLPHAARLDHPRFLAYVPSSPTWPAVIGDLLAAGFDVFQGTRLAAEGPCAVEDVVVDWFRRWIGLPEGAGGLLTSGGSAANLDAVVAAREAASAPAGGLVYVSAEAHSSMERACRVAGIGAERIRAVPCARGGAMRTGELARQLEADRRAGRRALLIGATAGTTSTGAVDDLPAVAELARQHGAWFHVDAAYGGFACLVARGRAALAGIERADSVTMDPHKWLFQPIEAGCLLMRDPSALLRAFHADPAYLRDAHEHDVLSNPADRGLQLTRSFRALKIWMSLMTFGRAAHARAIDRALDLAVEAATRVGDSERLALVTGPQLGILTFEARPDGWEALDGPARDGVQEALSRRAREEGAAFLSTTRVGGRRVLRMCILGHRTRSADVAAALAWLDRAAASWRAA